MHRIFILLAAGLASACSTAGMVQVDQNTDEFLDCPSIVAEIQTNKVRMEMLGAQSMNMLSGAFWFEDQATKSEALSRRNTHLADLARQKRCGASQ